MSNKIIMCVLFLFATTITLLLTVNADTCVVIPPNQEYIEYSRFIAFQIEHEGQVGKCWVTNRTGFEHFRASNYIWSLDGTAGPITSYPVIVSPISPTSPIYLPVIYIN